MLDWQIHVPTNYTDVACQLEEDDCDDDVRNDFDDFDDDDDDYDVDDDFDDGDDGDIVLEHRLLVQSWVASSTYISYSLLLKVSCIKNNTLITK